jgi:hypothetical protein
MKSINAFTATVVAAVSIASSAVLGAAPATAAPDPGITSSAGASVDDFPFRFTFIRFGTCTESSKDEWCQRLEEQPGPGQELVWVYFALDNLTNSTVLYDGRLQTMTDSNGRRYPIDWANSNSPLEVPPRPNLAPRLVFLVPPGTVPKFVTFRSTSCSSGGDITLTYQPTATQRGVECLPLKAWGSPGQGELPVPVPNASSIRRAPSS